MNCYEQITTMRDMVGEETADHWSDRELLKYLNTSQEKVGRLIALNNVDWLTVSGSVTPSSSVISFPSDCAKPIYLEETASGSPIPFSTGVMDRRVSRLAGTTLFTGVVEAYLQKGQIVVNQENYSSACTLWYVVRVPDLHLGTASAGAAMSLTLSAHDGIGVSSGGFGAKVIADYYNNCEVELLAGTGSGAIDTITDYTAARVATISGTCDSTTTYALISRLPEECHHLMWVEAALLAMAKPSSSIDPKYFGFLRERWKEAKEEFEDWISSSLAGGARIRITETQ